MQLCVKVWAIVAASVGHNTGDGCSPFMLYPTQDPTVW